MEEYYGMLESIRLKQQQQRVRGNFNGELRNQVAYRMVAINK